MTAHRQNRDAYLSLALTMRRISHSYRAFARESEQRGDLAGYRHCTSEADRTWRSAKHALDCAMREADFIPSNRSPIHAQDYARL